MNSNFYILNRISEYAKYIRKSIENKNEKNICQFCSVSLLNEDLFEMLYSIDCCTTNRLMPWYHA